jgi:hypothetical protein
MTIIEQAAHAMLAYEEWLRTRPAGTREYATRGYRGETADALIQRHVGGDVHAYVAVASPAIALATQLRGCSPTSVRPKDLRIKAERQAARRDAA